MFTVVEIQSNSSCSITLLYINLMEITSLEETTQLVSSWRCNAKLYEKHFQVCYFGSQVGFDSNDIYCIKKLKNQQFNFQKINQP